MLSRRSRREYVCLPVKAACMFAVPQAVGHMVSVSSGAGIFGTGIVIVAVLILTAAWVVLASSRFVQGGVVERPERVPQLYGYTVCLIALIWGLVSAVSSRDDSLSSRRRAPWHVRFKWVSPRHVVEAART